MFIPNRGRDDMSMGNNVQCIAQAMDVMIPNPSQFSFMFIKGKVNKKCNIVASFFR